MKFHIGNIPDLPGFHTETEGLRSIRGPKTFMSYLAAGLTGFALLIFPIMAFSLLLAYLTSPGAETVQGSDPPAAWGAVLLALLCFIPLHEFMHLICHPRLGLSNQSIVVLWPSKLIFGVYYEGCMPLRRWIIMRIAPLVVLSLIPAYLLSIYQNIPINYFFQTGLWVLTVLNGVGSGGDVMAILLVLFQVPLSAVMCFRGGRAYWRPNSVDNNPALISTQ